MIKQKEREKQIILCPSCDKGKLLVEGSHEITNRFELEFSAFGSQKRAEWYIKCPVCRKQIGMNVKINNW